MNMLRFLIPLVIVVASCNKKIPQVSTTTPEVKIETRAASAPIAKNIIFLIGDGMGLGQITAGMYANGNFTALEDFPVVGLHKCHASNNLITDSAAAATAFSCGVKTFNGAIGVNSDNVSVKTILEEAEEKGLATGLVATSTIVHATPASYIAHNKSRSNYEEIAEDFLDTEVDLLIGGGKKYFDRRSDDKNLLTDMSTYNVYSFLDTELKDIAIDVTKNLAYFTADDSPLSYDQGRDYLVPAAKLSYEFLKRKNDNGFFIMVEGSQIDWGGHANNQNYIITEFIEYDKVIRDALEFAKRDGNTLVVVTADHETGGFAIQRESTMDSLVTAFTSDYHTGTMIPVFAYGPGSDMFSGIYDNTSIYDKMRKVLGWE